MFWFLDIILQMLVQRPISANIGAVGHGIWSSGGLVGGDHITRGCSEQCVKPWYWGWCRWILWTEPWERIVHQRKRMGHNQYLHPQERQSQWFWSVWPPQKLGKWQLPLSKVLRSSHCLQWAFKMPRVLIVLISLTAVNTRCWLQNCNSPYWRH